MRRCVVFYYGTPPAERISFAWVGIPGMVVAALVVLVGSHLDGRKPGDLAGLTWKNFAAWPPGGSRGRVAQIVRGLCG